LTHPRTIF